MQPILVADGAGFIGVTVLEKMTGAASPGALEGLPPEWVTRIEGEICDFATVSELPSVVEDQISRITFADELARATAHLLRSGAPHGASNVSNGGAPCSWADLACRIFEHEGHRGDDVTPVSTAAYLVGREATAPGPQRSVLELDRLAASGFVPAEQLQGLADYLSHGASA